MRTASLVFIVLEASSIYCLRIEILDSEAPHLAAGCVNSELSLQGLHLLLAEVHGLGWNCGLSVLKKSPTTWAGGAGFNGSGCHNPPTYPGGIWWPRWA